MKRPLILLLLIMIIGCKSESRNKAEEKSASDEGKADTSAISLDALTSAEPVELNLEQANKLAELPLACINTEYPNKLDQTLGGDKDLQSPKELHPAFYGCFDWHSSVHAHWSLVKLLKHFPNLEKATQIREALEKSLTKENINAEIAYLQGEHNQDFERTYGWAWVLKLQEELETWDTDTGNKLAENLRPLADLVVQRTTEFLPKLLYPIRVGEHTNTAFALSFVHDYAVATENAELKEIVQERARDFYLNDKRCPISWEPSGFDFLSPCLQEVDLMRKVLPKAAFILWMENFMPELKSADYALAPGEVSDREDGKLVHLDGLNFSRAWVLAGLANQYPENYGHLRAVANQHIQHSFPNLVSDSYEGGHWLGSFALYSLEASKVKK